MAMIDMEAMRRESEEMGRASQQRAAAAAANHQTRLTQMAATGRPINPNFTNATTGVTNLANEDAAWQPGAGLERIARMEYDLAPGVRNMNAAQLREFVEGGGAAAWRAANAGPMPANDPFGGNRTPAFEDMYAQPGAPASARPPVSGLAAGMTTSGATPSAAPVPTVAPAVPPPPVMPPYTPTTSAPPGPYGDASVIGRVEAYTDRNNPLMKQARANGMAVANKRGLINSSMAAGAAQGEAYKVALPIAQQEATQVHQRNLAEVDNAAQGSRQAADIAAQMDRLRTQAGFETGRQTADNAAQMERLRTQAGFESERLAQQGQISASAQERTILAEMERLRFSTSASDQQQLRALQGQLDQIRTQGQVQGGLAGQQFGYQTQLNAQQYAAQADNLRAQTAAEMARLQTQLASAEGQQARDIQAQMERLQVTTAAEIQRITVQGTIQSALQSQGAEQSRALEMVRGTIQTGLQTLANEQQLQRMGVEFAQQTSINERNNAAQMERLKEAGGQEMARLLASTQADMARLNAQIAAGDRQSIASTMVNIFSAEAAMRQALLANTTMPAAERAAYEKAISSMGDPARAFINQLYSSPGAAAPAPPAAIAPPSTTTPIAGGGLDPGGVLTAPLPGGTFTSPAPTIPGGLMPPGLYGGPDYQNMQPL